MERDQTVSRPERPADYREISGILEAAAGREEAQLVELIRASDRYVPELALVAEDGGEILGHLMLSYVDLVGEEIARVLALAPMAVRPDRQRRGIGGRLIEAAVSSADRSNEPLIVVLGHASYYPRFGFEPARQYGIFPPDPHIPDPVFMIKRLSGYSPQLRGQIVYPAAFDVVAD